MNLPPLNALKYFESAARLLSFKKASVELSVTEAAVSRQIRQLEAFMGQALFRRHHRQVSLTRSGARLLPVVANSLAGLSRIAEEIRGGETSIALAATTSFAVRWLMPKLRDFETGHQDIRLSLLSSQAAPEEVDASIAYLRGAPPAGMDASRILDEYLLPVCAPGYLRDGKMFPANRLEGIRIILNEPTGRDWQLWASDKGGPQPSWENAMVFSVDDAAIQAAVAGQGVVLANLHYISNELSMGSLVPAIAGAPLKAGAHFLLSRPERAGGPALARFRDWLLKEAASSQRLLDSRLSMLSGVSERRT